MKRIIILLVMIASVFAVYAFADEPEIIAHTHVDLLSEAKAVAPGNEIRLAVKFTMENDWHVYWKNPGDSGLAPTIQWDLPDGFDVSEIRWPIPHRIFVDPIMTYGYENDVYLIVSGTVSSDWPVNKPIEIKAKIDWLACKVECIPGAVERALTIPVVVSGLLNNNAIVQQLDQAASQWPVVSSQINITATNRDHTVDFDIQPLDVLPEKTELYFFPDREDVIDHAAQQILHRENGRVQLRIPKSSISKASVLNQISGVLVSSNGWGNGSFHGIVVDVPLVQGAIADNPRKSVTLLAACLFAFLGGIILNLMPCVLPVLSLKVLALVKNAHNRRIMMTHGLLFSFGIVTSFWVLAAILILLKSAGHQIGWGFQFQSPYFVVFMAALLYVLALNLLGVFEFVPIAFSNEQFKKHPYGNSFVNGVLATTLATPCTAPFMGTALGYALTQSNLIAILIFTCLGIGMAVPYLFLSAFPRLLQWVPKPGAWMNNLKVFLGFILMGSVIWLVWVLGVQNGVHEMGLLLCGLLLISLCGWVYGLIRNESYSWQKLSWLVISGILSALLLYASASGQLRGLGESSSKGRSSSLVWQEFSSELVEQLIAEKKAVLIDFTAAWCLTCQVNDRLVFGNKNVQQAFKDLSVELIKADWTRKDPEITRALQTYGKSSIPLYVYYPAGSSAPEIWPEIITSEMVLRRLSPLSRQEKD